MDPDAAENRVLVLAPTGRDAGLLLETLRFAGVGAQSCPSLERLKADLLEGAAALILAQEALDSSRIAALAETIRAQPSWSDLPVLVLTTGTGDVERARLDVRFVEPLGNVTLLERPLRRTTLLSAVNSALRARRRQYEMRDHLLERTRTAEELARSNEDLRQFAMVAAHDLQEPIRTISSFAQLLAVRYQGRLDRDADDYIGHIVGGARRMGRLVEDLLNFAQLSTRPTLLSAQSAEAVLETALFNLSAKIAETGAMITYDPLPRIMADQMQIVQVFQNLISNAIKYKGSEPPRIHVSAAPDPDGWVFCVRDNGIGFKQEYAERIFGLFKRLHGREVPGTGIGLASCRKILERHGGRIWAESQEGKGASFYFTLTAADAAETVELRSVAD